LSKLSERRKAEIAKACSAELELGNTSVRKRKVQNIGILPLFLYFFSLFNKIKEKQ